MKATKVNFKKKVSYHQEVAPLIQAYLTISLRVVKELSQINASELMCMEQAIVSRVESGNSFHVRFETMVILDIVFPGWSFQDFYSKPYVREIHKEVLAHEPKPLLAQRLEAAFGDLIAAI